MRDRAGTSKGRLVFRATVLVGVALALGATLARGVLAGEPPAPGPLDHFVFDPIDDPQTAGVPIDVVVTAYDVNGFVKTDYEGGAVFLDTLNAAPDGTPPVYGELSFVDGVATTTVTAFDATEEEETVVLTVEDPGESFLIGRALLGEEVPSGTSNEFTVDPADPDNIVFGQQPSRTLVDTVITPGPTVIVRDLYHNVATQATNPVQMAIGENPGLGSLLGTTSQAPVDGVATFDDLVVDESGAGYTLVAMTDISEDTASATSDPFDVPNVIVPCGGGGCSASASNSATTVNVAVPTGGGPARVSAGVVDDLAIALNAPNGSLTCGDVAATAIGSISLVDPPSGFTQANPIKVTIIYPEGVVRIRLRKLVLCKDSGPGTPFFVVPKCRRGDDDDPRRPKVAAPCEKSRRYLDDDDVRFPAVKIVLLITSIDPKLASK